MARIATFQVAIADLEGATGYDFNTYAASDPLSRIPVGQEALPKSTIRRLGAGAGVPKIQASAGDRVSVIACACTLRRAAGSRGKGRGLLWNG